MGKPRRKTGRSGKGKEDILRRLNVEVDGLAIGDGKKKKKRDRPPLTVQECLDKARNALDAYNTDEAFRLCTSALQLEPDNVSALETMGTILCEKRNLKSAKEHFERAVTLCPEKGYAKYMSLAQLVEGEESVKHFKKGLELMELQKEKIIKGEDEEEEEVQGAGALPSTSPMAKLEELQSDISRGHISVAEIYLTDLCEAEDAASVCKYHLDKAIESKPSSPEAHQLLASWCISMMDDEEEGDDKFEEAKKAIQTAVALWLPQYQKATAEDDEDDDSPTAAASLLSGPSTSAAAMADPVQPCPLSVDERIDTAKYLIELFMMKSDEDQLANLAVEVLDTILDEDDENIFVWYLLGWIGCMQGKEQYVNSKLSLEQALQIGSKKGYLQSGQYGVDKEQIQAVLDELKKKMEEENVVAEEEEEDDDDEIIDEEYETEEEED